MLKIKVKKLHSEWWTYVWSRRKWMGCLTGIALLVALVVTISTPAEYQTDIFTVAEARVAYVNSEGVMSDNSNGSTERVRDAILPSRYRQVMGSPQFLLPFTQIKVRLSDDEHTEMTLYEYMSLHQRYPWWRYVRSAILRLPSFVLSPFRGGGGSRAAAQVSDSLPLTTLPEKGPIRLTRRDAVVMSALRKRIGVEISSEKQSVTLQVRMQDPLVSAIVADSLLTHICAYMTGYRQDKERARLLENEALHRQAQQDYYDAQDEYARFADMHADPSGVEIRSQLSNLRLQMQLAYLEYERTASLVQSSRRRVATERPVLTVVEGAQVPRRPVAPSLPKIFGACLLLAWTGGLGWLWLEKRRFIIRYKKRPRRRIVLPAFMRRRIRPGAHTYI